MWWYCPKLRRKPNNFRPIVLLLRRNSNLLVSVPIWWSYVVFSQRGELNDQDKGMSLMYHG